MQGVTLSQQAQTRLKVLNSVLVGQLPVGQAAEVLGISERHVQAHPGGLPGGKEPPRWSTGIEAVDLPTPQPRRRLPR